MNNLKEKKLDNKGFSLVELIIVIAIMAVLIGVLAPQYIKYVERSRNSTDRDNAAAISSALQVWASETDLAGGRSYGTDTTGTTLTVTANADVAITGANAGAVSDALINASLATGTIGTGTATCGTRCASKTAWTQYVVTVKLDHKGDTNATNHSD